MLTVTGLYTTLFAFLILTLALRVVRLRRKHRVGLLDGGHDDLIKAIRIHGNAIETIPIALIMMACAESAQLRPFWLHVAGLILLIARLYHVFGLNASHGYSKGRTYGTLLTWLIVCSLGFYNIFIFVRPLFL